MSIRTTLIGGTILLLLASFATLSVLAISSIHHSVVREAQARVDHNLATVSAFLDEEQADLARLLVDGTESLRVDGGDPLSSRLQQIRQGLGLTVLNVCAADGRPLAGTFTSGARVPVARDPILRKALGGQSAHGTVVLDERRLELEGGRALVDAMAVYAPGDEGARRSSNAMFWWIARPVFDERGGVEAILYGGRALNHASELVDRLRDILFGTERYGGKPLGTITIFLDDVRVATNVLGPDGSRAEGTLVSPEVREQVIEQGRTWQDRAWVVDASYLSGYLPIADATGRSVGMLYVGLLEAPYGEIKRQLVRRFAIPGGVALAVAVLFALVVIRRLVGPLRRLSETATSIGEGHWEPVADRPSRSFVEIDALEQAFARMRNGIEGRDRALREKNDTLEQLNERLRRTNDNYMQMLGFVTHEMRSPVAAMQSLADTLTAGLAGALPDRARELSTRISRNAVELQDMVRDYLALSRLERGELEARMTTVDLRSEVVDDAIEQVAPELEARSMRVTLEAPTSLPALVDAALVRIVIVNFLSNAAKYGRNGAEVSVRLVAGDDRVSIRVRNEGEGFTEQERSSLFQRFSRLRNASTRGRRGSGLGLFLCREIAALHDGTVSAESLPGAWAEFRLELPLRQRDATAASPDPDTRTQGGAHGHPEASALDR